MSLGYKTYDIPGARLHYQNDICGVMGLTCLTKLVRFLYIIFFNILSNPRKLMQGLEKL